MLTKIVQRCEEEDISSAASYVLRLLKHPEKRPSNYFGTQTDHLVPSAISKIVCQLNITPRAYLNEPAFFLITQVMRITCDGTLYEERGPSMSAYRWLGVFTECFASVPPNLLFLTLWALTFESKDFIEPALDILDKNHFTASKGSWSPRAGQRNRCLCEFRNQLRAFDKQAARDFNKRLRGTGKCRHLCYGCVGWHLGLKVGFKKAPGGAAIVP